MIVMIIIRDICQIKDEEEAWSCGVAGARPGIERSCSFSAFANPSCVFSVGEEEEGRAPGPWGGCAGGHRAGLGHSRAWDTPRVMSPALCHRHPALLGVLCTPKSWCIPSDEFCAF